MKIKGKTMQEWKKENAIMEQIISTQPVFWKNPKYQPNADWSKFTLGSKHIQDAKVRLEKFSSYISTVFPETCRSNGIVESSLISTPKTKAYLEKRYAIDILGDLWMKCDSHLPISGSIKARGGVYEVLKHAETLAIENNLLSPNEDYSVMATDRFRQFFSNYSIAVGSTGNLGLSIGIISAKLGFKVTVHMSADAKKWKKRLLHQRGVEVKEYVSDYSKAVQEGRKQAEKDANCYFVDDENSTDLFLGYAVAAFRLQEQCKAQGIDVDEEHPLFVYLPCGVGGGPGGVTFGLKLVFGAHVHCFFSEPTHSPSMLLGLLTELHDQVSVHDFGIDNQTEADGLAVGRPSRFVGKMMDNLLSGCFTISDKELYTLLTAVADLEGIHLEPSALAGVSGVAKLIESEVGNSFLKAHSLDKRMKNATHIAWITGGSMVPKEVQDTYYAKGVSFKKE